MINSFFSDFHKEKYIYYSSAFRTEEYVFLKQERYSCDGYYGTEDLDGSDLFFKEKDYDGNYENRGCGHQS